MSRDRYLPPTRPIKRAPRYLPPVPQPEATATPATPASDALDPHELVRQLLSVPVAEGNSFFGALRERFALDRNANRAERYVSLLTRAMTILETTNKVEEHRLNLELVRLRHEVERARLEMELAEHRRRKRDAEDD